MDGLKFLWIASTLLTFFSKMATTVKRERFEYARDLVALVAKPYRRNRNICIWPSDEVFEETF